VSIAPIASFLCLLVHSRWIIMHSLGFSLQTQQRPDADQASSLRAIP